MKRIKEYDTVVVGLPDEIKVRETSFACRVIAIAGATVALEPLEEVTTLSLPERVPGSLMIFRHDGALVALKGVLVQQGPVGDLRFKVTDRVEHGRASRTEICLPVAVCRAGSEDEPVQGTTVDLSADGLTVQSPLTAALGAPVQASLSLPGHDEPIEVVATVVDAATGTLQLGLATADRDARRRLAQFVLERNRASLRRERSEPDDLDF